MLPRQDKWHQTGSEKQGHFLKRGHNNISFKTRFFVLRGKVL